MTRLENGQFDEEKMLEMIMERYQKAISNPLSLSQNIYEQAWEIVWRAKKKAQEIGIDVVITLVDKSAQVVMTYRMQDALLVSNDMAYKKAYTAVAMKMQSKDLAPLTQPGQWLYQLETMTDNKIVSLPGGIPVFAGDKLVGAIGISGGNAEQDQIIAESALL